jgi:hypothetical protein
LDGSITRVDGERGRLLGPPVPVGPAPWQVVAGPAGRLLVLASVTSAHPSGDLRHIVPSAAGVVAGAAGERWAARPVRLEPGGGAGIRAGRLAGAGRWAVVAYDVRPGGAAAPADGGRLALLDLGSGAVARTHPVPAGPGASSVLSLALGGDAVAPVVYLGLWDWAAAGGRVLALRADTGVLVAAAPTAGAPTALTLGAAPGGGARLYGVEAAPGPDAHDGDDPHAAAQEWRVRGRDPWTLAPETEHRLAVAPRWFALASDEDRGYALTGGDASLGSTALLQLDLTTGATRPLAPPPGPARELVATRGHLYALDAQGDRLWGFDRQSGRLVRTIPVGRRPIALTHNGSWP